MSDLSNTDVEVMCDDGVRRPVSDCVLCADDEYRVADACVLCADGEYRPTDECVECDDGEWNPCDECVECGDNAWRLRSDCTRDYEGVWWLTSEVVETMGGEIAHSEDENIVCLTDGGYEFVDNCSCIDDEWYLDEDCFTCESCHDRSHNTNVCDGPGGSTVCYSCLEHHTVVCDQCGDPEWEDDVRWDDDTAYCSGCWSDRTTPRLIQCYTDRSANRMESESRDRVLYGIELEVESKRTQDAGAMFARSLLSDKYCVFKHDGSLGETGFEIVTRPDSVAVHKKQWAAFFDASPNTMLSSWTTGRCGMHVHVSRAGLSQLQLGKMLCFLNEPANSTLIVKIAGRRSERWSRLEKKKFGDVWAPPERYSALNLCNPHTVEFRIFKGTISETAFFKNIEFCEALVEFTAPAQRSLADATSWRAFCNWLPYKQYPYLYEFLVSRGFVIDRRPKRRSA